MKDGAISYEVMKKLGAQNHDVEEMLNLLPFGDKKSFKLLARDLLPNDTPDPILSTLSRRDPGWFGGHSQSNTETDANAPTPQTGEVADIENKINQDYQKDGYGNWVVDRKTGKQFWEYMPTFTAVGMHLAFNTTHFGPELLEPIFKWFSEYMGKEYDNTDPKYVQGHIQAFIADYKIDTSQLLIQDFTQYPTFNSFFSRKLKVGARPIAGPNDPSIVTSPADSRCVVFESTQEAQNIWIKGKDFTVAKLLDISTEQATELFGDAPEIAVFRLAPQDYHRFHAPIDAKLGNRTVLAGNYYTVNPQAVKEDLDVFAANHRAVQMLNHKNGKNFAFVAVGALLVGSIQFSQDPHTSINKGDDMGYFQYGGSTTVMVAPKGSVKWDSDLLRNSRSGVETLIQVGEQIGKMCAMADDDRAAKAARAKALLKSHQKKKKVGAPVPSNLSHLAGSSQGPQSIESASVLFSPPGSEAPVPDDRSDLGWLGGDATPPLNGRGASAPTDVSAPVSPHPMPHTPPVPPPPTKKESNASPITRPMPVSSPLSVTTVTPPRVELEPEPQPKEPAVDVAALQSSLQSQQQTISFLVAEKASLTTALEHLEGIEQRSQQTEKQLEESRAATESLNERVAQLERECAEAQHISSNLRETSSNMSERAHNAERELEITKRGVTDLKTQLSQQRARVRQLEEQIEQDDRVEQIERSMKGAQDRAESLEFQLSKLKQTHGKIKSERDAFEQQLADQTETEGKWKAKHDELSTNHDQALSTLAGLTAERDRILKEHTSLKSQHSTAQQSIASLQSQTSQLSHQHSSHQSEITSVNKRLIQAQDTAKTLQKENVELLSRLDEMGPRIVELQEDKVELADRIGDLESELRKREALIGDLEAQLDETNVRVGELEEEHSHLDSQHARERKRLEELTEEQQRAYTALEAELSDTKAIVQELTTERTSARYTANQLQDEVDRLRAKDKHVAREIQALKSELDEHASSGSEVTEMMDRLREEVEALRTELSLKDEEIIRTKAQLDEANLLIQATANSATASPVAENSTLSEEMTHALKQQHALELSEAQSQIRTLDTLLFQEQAKTHTLQRRITALEDEVHMLNIQLASASVPSPQRLHSPRLNGGSRGPSPANGKLQRPTTTASRTPSSSSLKHHHHQDNLNVVPPHPAIDSALSPEARHKRKVSLSMLKARIESEMALRMVPVATGPNGHSGLHSLNEADEVEASPQQRRKAVAMLSRPQFGDESHVFCCASCAGDLVVL
ncbi:hypothetical protein FRB96_000734 [Tulasnella sp. 330]|nr:hypothetical protein FRB96_000734 [Tulasnella sp. 330]